MGRLNHHNCRTRASDDRHASGGGLHHFADDAVLFVVAERRAFTGGAARHDALGPLGNVPLDQLFQRRKIDLVIFEWGDDGDDRTAEWLCGHGDLPGGREGCRSLPNTLAKIPRRAARALSSDA